MKELSIRIAEQEDTLYLARWLNDPEILSWFPMCNEKEIQDAIRIWVGYISKKATLTALWNGVPCAMANLYIQPFKKLAHQCLFAVVADRAHRGKGVGTRLLNELMKLAKQSFGIEILHLEVYEGNPAINLYNRLGFKEFGYQAHFVKEMGRYRGKIFMQKELHTA